MSCSVILMISCLRAEGTSLSPPPPQPPGGTVGVGGRDVGMDMGHEGEAWGQTQGQPDRPCRQKNLGDRQTMGMEYGNKHRDLGDRQTNHEGRHRQTTSTDTGTLRTDTETTRTDRHPLGTDRDHCAPRTPTALPHQYSSQRVSLLDQCHPCMSQCHPSALPACSSIPVPAQHVPVVPTVSQHCYCKPQYIPVAF